MIYESETELGCPRCGSPLIVAWHDALVVQRVELGDGEIEYLAWRSDDVHLGREWFVCGDCEHRADDWREFLPPEPGADPRNEISDRPRPRLTRVARSAWSLGYRIAKTRRGGSARAQARRRDHVDPPHPGSEPKP